MTRRGTCKHFTGISLPGGDDRGACNAGVDYRAHVGGPNLGWAARLPCIKVGRARPSEPPVPCALYVEPTQAEIDAAEAEWKAVLARMELTFPLIERIKRQRKGRNWSGVEECPACKGRLHLSHAAYNGHVHGRCETADCLQWME